VPQEEEDRVSSLPRIEEASTTLAEVQATIVNRRSIGAMRPDAPPRESIAMMLDAATQAPNHHRTEPWFFHVITGEARAWLGAIAAEAMQERGETGAAITKTRGAFLRAPVVIMVTVGAGRDAVETVENRDAVCAAIQNMLLVGTALGLATMWRTGKLVAEPAIREAIGLVDGEAIVGYIYVGYPTVQPAPRQRQPWSARSRWWGREA
jgi:nitroreductase